MKNLLQKQPILVCFLNARLYKKIYYFFNRSLILWAIQLYRYVKDLPQFLQTYGFSPVWILYSQ